jgi:ADP-ribose pyrophosphatase YjhB (NUDIX family)
MPLSKLIDWAQRLQSIAQSGLTYTQQPFDRLRYEDVRDIAVEMMASTGAGLSPDDIRALFDAQQGHTTPKVDVRGAVFRGDTILLVQEKMDANRWTLPGGWADVGESAGDGVAREIWEETGYRARPVNSWRLSTATNTSIRRCCFTPTSCSSCARWPAMCASRTRAMSRRARLAGFAPTRLRNCR